MKYLFIFFMFANAHAQEATDPSKYVIGKEGQIFTLKITPKDKRIEVRFVDTPLVEIEPTRLLFSGSLQVEERGNKLYLKQPLEDNQIYKIKIKDKVTNKSEVIQIKTRP